MKRLLIFTLLLLPGFILASVPQWGRYEIKLKGTSTGNPFMEINLSADFWQTGKDTIRVTGFYDGDGKYIIRFMPPQTGEWRYVTHSNDKRLNGKKGKLTCEITPQQHGPVIAVDRHFCYADSTPYIPIGTTAYAWIHMPHEIVNQTIQQLRLAQFNKVRMCVFPKHYALCRELPEMYPFVSSGTANPNPNAKKSGMTFDYERFNPAFFHHLENMIDSLASFGCEADLILFHPYDKGYWGFDSMPMEVNLRYLQYLQARLSSFHNVWWALANEYDLVKQKSEDAWCQLIAAVKKNDPYRHLVSIHGSTATYFPYEREGLTHTSIQDEAPVIQQGRAGILWSIYKIPVVLDEVRYEGNLPYRWGRISGEEMINTMWNGILMGCYVTHGECYQYKAGDYDTIFWAKGGSWRGESWKRIGFMRNILTDLPNPLEAADISRDDQISTAGDGYYLVYFGTEAPTYWEFNLPQKNASYPKLHAGRKFKAEIIDTWNMTIDKCPTIFETDKVNDYRIKDKHRQGIALPGKPYILLRIKEIK